MGCGCAGSTPRQAPAARTLDRPADEAPATASKSEGGPGTPGFYWNGPERPSQRVPEPAAN